MWKNYGSLMSTSNTKIKLMELAVVANQFLLWLKQQKQ